VATDNGMLHKLRTLNPGKTFIEAPTAGNSATCKSCAHCPWMAMNGLAGVARVLEHGLNEVHVEARYLDRARLPIDRDADVYRCVEKWAAGGQLDPEYRGGLRSDS